MTVRYPDLPGHNYRSTSKAAALEIIPHLTGLRLTVFDLIAEKPRTCDEIEKETSLAHQTASARITELSKMGFIVPSGMERKTRSGRNAIVWGVAKLQQEIPF